MRVIFEVDSATRATDRFEETQLTAVGRLLPIAGLRGSNCVCLAYCMRRHPARSGPWCPSRVFPHTRQWRVWRARRTTRSRPRPDCLTIAANSDFEKNPIVTNLELEGEYH